MDINEVLCLCTYVTDLCTSLISKNCESMICEIVDRWLILYYSKHVGLQKFSFLARPPVMSLLL